LYGRFSGLLSKGFGLLWLHQTQTSADLTMVTNACDLLQFEKYKGSHISMDTRAICLL
jgi:hypothetical protein